MKRNLIAVIAVIVVAAITAACIIFIPKITSLTKDSKNDGSVTTHAATVNIAKTMPKDAGKDAVTWYVELMNKLDSSSLPKDFFSNSESTDILNKFASGDYDKVPKEVQDAFYFSDDAQAFSEDNLIDYATLKASAITALIMSWQLHATTVKNDKSFTPSQAGVMVDREHAQVVFPMETVCNLPVTITIVLDWDGSNWKIDGDTVGSQVSSQVRSNQLQQKYEEAKKPQE